MVITKLTVCAFSVAFPDCAGLTPVMKLVTDCTPASSFTAGGLPGDVKVGPSLPGFTVSENHPVTGE